MITLTVTPSNELFSQLENNQSSFGHLLSELIDNSVSAMEGDECNILIEVNGPWTDGSGKSAGKLNRAKAKLIISDDSSGIPLNILADALAPANLANHRGSNSLNEHGIGLKTAIVSLGSQKSKDGEIIGVSLITKTKDMPKALLIDKLCFGKIDVQEIDAGKYFPKGHGTRIEITNLKDKVYSGKENYEDNNVFCKTCFNTLHSLGVIVHEK